MKIILLFSLVAHLSFASTFEFFTPTDQVTLNDNTTFEIINDMTIDLRTENILINGRHNSQAKIIVNNKKDVFKLSILNSYIDEDGTLHLKLSAILKTDIISDLMCSEREDVYYKLTFDMSKNTVENYSALKNVSLSAIHSYTYDSCHEMPDYQEYPYLLK